VLVGSDQEGGAMQDHVIHGANTNGRSGRSTPIASGSLVE
jgi:hypothetical protein